MSELEKTNENRSDALTKKMDKKERIHLTLLVFGVLTWFTMGCYILQMKTVEWFIPDLLPFLNKEIFNTTFKYVIHLPLAIIFSFFLLKGNVFNELKKMATKKTKEQKQDEPKPIKESKKTTEKKKSYGNKVVEEMLGLVIFFGFGTIIFYFVQYFVYRYGFYYYFPFLAETVFGVTLYVPIFITNSLLFIHFMNKKCDIYQDDFKNLNSFFKKIKKTKKEQ